MRVRARARAKARVRLRLRLRLRVRVRVRPWGLAPPSAAWIAHAAIASRRCSPVKGVYGVCEGLVKSGCGVRRGCTDECLS